MITCIILQEDLQQAKQDLMLTLKRICKLAQTKCSLALILLTRRDCNLHRLPQLSMFTLLQKPYCCFAAETVLLLCCRKHFFALVQKLYCCSAAETVLLLCCRNRIAALVQKPYCCSGAETVLLQG